MKEQLQKEIDQLRIEFKDVQERLLKKVNEMKEVLNKEDAEFIKTISDDINQITDVQWEWILYHFHDETTTRYYYSSNFLQNLGFFTSGFSKERQFVLLVSQYGIESNYNKIIKNLPLVLKHIKIKKIDVLLEIEDDVHFDFNEDDNEYTIIKNSFPMLKTKSLQKILDCIIKMIESNIS